MAWSADSAEVVLAVANQGVIATAATRVAVELPELPDLNVGDTFSVTGAGAGGWAVYPAADTRIRATTIPGSGKWFAAAPQENHTNEERSWISVSPDGSMVADTALSRDGGRTWLYPAGQGLRVTKRRTFSGDGTRIMAQDSIPVFMNTSNLMGAAANGTLYLSDNGGSFFVSKTPPMAGSAALARDGLHIVTVSVSVTSGAVSVRSARSEDFGTTWGPVRTSSVGNSTNTVSASQQGWPVISPDGRWVYVCVAFYGFWRMFVSSDFGDTFESRVEQGITQLRLSGDGTRLFKRVDPGVNNGTWHRSTDHGLTWTAISPASRGSLDFDSDLASSYDGQTLALAGGTGVLLSVDGGTTWQTLSDPPRPYNTSPLIYGEQRIERVALSDDGSYLVGTGAVSLGTRWLKSMFTVPLIGSGAALEGQLGDSLSLVYVGDGTFNVVNASGRIALR
jgi:hypothetical protein